jgi:hypothetical protein
VRSANKFRISLFRIGRYIAFSPSLARFPFKMGCLTHYIICHLMTEALFPSPHILDNQLTCVYRLEIYQTEEASLERREMEAPKIEFSFKEKTFHLRFIFPFRLQKSPISDILKAFPFPSSSTLSNAL